MNAALLWKELGKLLAAEDGLIVVTGGLKARLDSPNHPTADWTIIDGVLEGLRSSGIPAEERVETVLPDREKDFSKLVRFHEGRIQVLSHRTPQARRFSMVHSADVVISVEGEHGTRSVLDVALAIERPILPLPFGGGSSAEAWRDVRSEICSWFEITDTEATDFEQLRLADLCDTEIRALAKRVCSCLLRGFTRSCFIIMPFQEASDPVYDNAIVPALAAHGLHPVRTDRVVPTGNVVGAIRDGLRHCFFSNCRHHRRSP